MDSAENNGSEIAGREFWGTEPNLRSVEEIPPPFHQIFAKYRSFNVLQSKVFDEVFYTDNPLVISAPTGSGKTVIFELAIVRLLVNAKYNNGSSSFRAVYMAPMKALCEERFLDWHARFNGFGINCISVTGDSDNVDCQSLMSYNLIISTPEKWDVITRKWKDNKSLVESVVLFMIDEVHLLNEDARGPTLEAVVSRMKIIQSYVGASHKIRFIALSATIPNGEDIAEWLDQCSTSTTKCFKFSDDYRPVKLTKVVLGYPFNPLHSTPFKFDIMLNYKLHPVMLKYAQGRPVLIFCSTRKSVEMTAKHLMLNVTVDLTAEQRRVLQEAAAAVTDAGVRGLLVHGIACHHAGMLAENRRAVEALFRKGHLPILVATSTLAMGVNLPAHLVIVKTTKCYHNGEYTSYSESAILQMIGRAGRPGFDTSAFAVIMTTTDEKEKYENMVSGSQCVESNFHLHLTEHLNSEVVLATISDLWVAMEWLASTFLYVRAKKHPKHYGLPIGLTTDQLNKKLLEMCQIEINKLAKAGMLHIDENTSITPLFLGYLMAKYYLAFDTMKLFTQINGTEVLPKMLNLISNCQEFSDLYLRVNDKKALNLLNKCKNKETIRFPLSGRIKTLNMKINCLIQAVFGSLEVLDHSLQNDAQKIMRSGERISRCLLDYLESPDFIQVHPRAYSALLSANILAKCFHARLWENSKNVARQLPGIGSALSAHLVAADKTSFQLILESNPRDLERILSRKPPFGNDIHDFVAHLPKYVLQVSHETNEKGVGVKFAITLSNAAEIEEKCTIDRNGYMVLLVGDSFNNIYFYEKYSHDYMIQNGEIGKSFEVNAVEKIEVGVHFISQTWVGIDCTEKLVFNAKNETHTKPTKTKKTVNKKLAEEKKEAPKKPPVTIQQFLDAYMKKTKPIASKSRATPPTPEKQPTPPPLADDRKSVSSDATDFSDDDFDFEEIDSLEKEATAAQSDNAKNLQVEDKMVFDIMDEMYDDTLTSEKDTILSENNDTKNSCVSADQNSNGVRKQQDDHSSKYLYENTFQNNKSQNSFTPKSQNVESQPDSTCDGEVSIKTFEKPKKPYDHQHQDQKNTKSITWRSPLIISSPASNYRPKIDFVQNSVDVPEREVVPKHFNSEKKPQSPKFSTKLLDSSSGSTPPQKMVPPKNKICKFQLADRKYSTQPTYAEGFQVNAEPSLNTSGQVEIARRLTQPNQNLQYDSIKVVDSSASKPKILGRLSPASDKSDYSVASTSRSDVCEGSFKSANQKREGEVKEYRLKNFLSQFQKEQRAKLDGAVSSSQQSASKWRQFLEEPENDEEKRSWGDECDVFEKPEYLSYKPRPPKRKVSEGFFDFPSTSKKWTPQEKMCPSYCVDHSFEEPMPYSASPLRTPVSAQSRRPPISYGPSTSSTITRAPQRYIADHNVFPQQNRRNPIVENPSSLPLVFPQENRPFKEVPPPLPLTKFKQPYFEESHYRVPYVDHFLEQRPPQLWETPRERYAPPQRFSQPPVRHIPQFAVPGQGAHCSCCPRVVYDVPAARGPFMDPSCSHWVTEDEQYLEEPF